MDKINQGGGVASVVVGVLGVLGAFLTIFGAIQMRGLRTYGLAMFGAVLAAIPCLSISACCGLGELAGIWAIVVLLNQEVKAAFR
jgi:hypothetical protein